VVSAAPAVGALPDSQRPVDHSDPAVAEGQQVADGQFTAPPVVHGHRAVTGRAGPVQQNHGGAAVPDALDGRGAAVYRGDQDAADALFLQDPQVTAFLVFGLV
jgi:hypothetical protein